MANYLVRFPRTKESIKDEYEKNKQYGRDWKVCPYFNVYIDIDTFILAILDCERDGIMIRRTMERICPSYSKKTSPNANYVVGKMVWASSKRLLSTKVRHIDETLPTVTFLKDLGDAFIKCYRVAEKFDVVKASRNDDRFRYWCNFNMKDRIFTFESIVLKRWYRDTMIKEAKDNATINNVLYLLTQWDNYINLDLNLISDLSSYTKNKVKTTPTVDSLRKVEAYLVLLNFFIGRMYDDIEVVDGKERRIDKAFPTELYTPYYTKFKEVIDKLKGIRAEFDIIEDAAHTLPKSSFNFNALSSTSYSIGNVITYWESTISGAADININFRKQFKDSDMRGLDTYNGMTERYEKVMSKDKRAKQCFGYYCYGPRYSRMANRRDNRPRIFI